MRVTEPGTLARLVREFHARFPDRDGVVNPNDIRAGNVVASSDVVNANLEAVGDGEVSDTASRSWLQRVLTKSLAVW